MRISVAYTFAVVTNEFVSSCVSCELNQYLNSQNLKLLANWEWEEQVHSISFHQQGWHSRAGRMLYSSTIFLFTLL